MSAEPCAHCGLAASEYTRSDLLGTFRALPPIWRSMTDGVPESVLAARSAAGSESAFEGAARTRDLTNATAEALRRALTEENPLVERVFADASAPRVTSSLRHALAELEESVTQLNATAVAMSAPDWERQLVVGAEALGIEQLLARAVHDGTHRVCDAGRGIHALGAGAPSHDGTVEQVSASDGGVPKAALAAAVIGRRGIAGDRQAERRHHGRPLQALCIWSQEVIDALRAEGHPVYAGAAGENVTTRGIDWSTIRPGVRMAIGGALVEISAFATPCAKNAQWFADRDFDRIDHRLHPGWSRAYAWVIDGGAVAPGDVVLVEP